MEVMIWVVGFMSCFLICIICNLPYLQRKIRQRKTEDQKNPDKKITTTKLVLFSILFTYYAAFVVAMYVVIFRDVSELSNLLTFVGGATVFAVAFYCWKAKAENLEKIKNRSPEMESSLSDFANMGSQ